MFANVLLVCLLVGQAAIVWAIFEMKWSFEAWADAWGRTPRPATDHNLTETRKTLEELAHYAALKESRAS